MAVPFDAWLLGHWVALVASCSVVCLGLARVRATGLLRAVARVAAAAVRLFSITRRAAVPLATVCLLLASLAGHVSARVLDDTGDAAWRAGSASSLQVLCPTLDDLGRPQSL